MGTLAVYVLAWMGPAAKAIPIISNGSFELPVASPGVHSGYPTSWSGYGNMSIINGTVANNPTPQDGNQFVNIDSGSLVQRFTIATPGDYLLTWFDNTYTSGNNGSYSVLLEDSSLTRVSFTAYSYNYSGAAWHARSLDLNNLMAGTYTLTYGPGTSATFLDNVVLDMKTTTSVPDSGNTAGLLGLAFVGMALAAARRRAALS